MKHFPFKSKGFWGSVFVIVAAAYQLITGDYETAAALFGIGLSLLGIRHKLEYVRKGR